MLRCGERFYPFRRKAKPTDQLALHTKPGARVQAGTGFGVELGKKKGKNFLCTPSDKA